MKAFLVGLVFICAALILAGLCVLLSPLLLVFGVILQAVLMAAAGIFSIWVLGKLIIFAWEKLFRK
jgi:hypothetical protein